MTWEIFARIAGQYGIPTAAVLFVLWLSMTGRILWAREALQSEKDLETARKDAERQLAEIRRDLERQLTEMTKDRDYYRDTTMDLLTRYGTAVDTSESAIRTATRVIGRRP